MSMTAPATERVLLPFRHLQWRSTIVALAAAAVPACAAALWLATQGGQIRPALMLTGLVMVAAGVVSWLSLRARIVVDADGLRVRTMDPREREVPRTRVTRAVVRAIHAPDDLKVTRHLFLLDADARTVFRMCDQWWTEAQLGRVARHFQVPLESQPEPVHLAELRRTVPQQLRWRERHPMLTRAAIAVGGFACCLVIGWLAATSL